MFLKIQELIFFYLEILIFIDIFTSITVFCTLLFHFVCPEHGNKLLALVYALVSQRLSFLGLSPTWLRYISWIR